MLSPSYTNLSYMVSQAFHRERMLARAGSLLAALAGRSSRLKSLADSDVLNGQTKLYTGIQSVPTEKIVGTISRTDDFDDKFRPRKRHLRNRWINMFILLQSDGWPPIRLHKAGDVYYVEDGHHRVSVARSVGMMYIEAEVWDHATQAVQPCACQPQRRLTAAVCACGTD